MFQEGCLKANQQLVKENNKLLKAQNLINTGKGFSRMQNVSPDKLFYSKLYIYDIQET